MILLNFYLLSLQLEILANVQGCTNLAILDAALFFYQWLFHLNQRFIFIIVTNHNQKIFQVPIMRYIIWMAYVQHEIDKILQDIYTWVYTYIDDIIYKTKYLPNLFKKLHIIFNIFLEYNLSIKLSISFLIYPKIRLLS